MATNETFCTACQRVAYIAEGALLECPVCSSPLLTTVDDDPDAPTEPTEGLSAAG